MLAKSQELPGCCFGSKAVVTCYCKNTMNMTLRPLLYIVLLMMSLRAGAQAFIPPDYKAIEAAVKDKNSAYYYPPLYQRFIANDTTLTADEYKYVYFGNFFVDHPVSEFARDQNALYGIAHLKKKEIA